MQTSKASSWKEFEQLTSGLPAGALFRGQTRAVWKLQHSLERYSAIPFSVQRYNACLLRIKPALESYSGRSVSLVENTEDYPANAIPPNYEFMCHVRHLGFPSPLIDWSRSAWIALFCAFQNAMLDEEVAVYVYTPPGSADSSSSQIILQPQPYLPPKSVHYLQQNQFTLALKKINRDWFYASHEEICNAQPEQHALHKITLPGYLKFSMLKNVHDMNINAYTLNGTEDGLMHTLAFTEILQYNEAMMNT